jgi:hypothetical protein
LCCLQSSPEHTAETYTCPCSSLVLAKQNITLNKHDITSKHDFPSKHDISNHTSYQNKISQQNKISHKNMT